MTLERRTEGKNKNAVEKKHNFGRQCDLPKQLENELLKHILVLEECFLAFISNDLRRLEYQLVGVRNIPHRFDQENGAAGNKLCYSFVRSLPEVSLRQPESNQLSEHGVLLRKG
jgi:hypothetical protein